jgi:hypothetical protein
MRRRLTRCAAIILAAVAAAGGCSKAPAPASAPARHHEHHPPHGGTPMVLGDEVYHLELVLDAQAGVLQAYVLDGEMENFVRCAAPSIVVDAMVGGKPESVALEPVANAATGETAGDTALFEGRADWLVGARDFDGAVRSVTVRGTTFSGVTFNFPRGNDSD